MNGGSCDAVNTGELSLQKGAAYTLVWTPRLLCPLQCHCVLGTAIDHMLSKSQQKYTAQDRVKKKWCSPVSCHEALVMLAQPEFLVERDMCGQYQPQAASGCRSSHHNTQQTTHFSCLSVSSTFLL